MGIHVCQSHNVDFLLEGVMRQLNQPTASILDVFQTQSFIVPNKSVEKWLTQKIAEKTGVTANYEYFNKISAFQWKAYQKVVEDKDKVAKSLMPRIIIKWRIFEAIKPYIAAADNKIPFDAPLSSIVSRIYESSSQIQNPQEALDKRHGMLYWVADQVSRLFTNYMTYRSECDKHRGACDCSNNWLQSWSHNQPANVETWFNGAPDDLLKLQHTLHLEEWQRWLWFQLFAEEYSRFKEVDADFWSCIESETTRRGALASLPRQLIVFTLLDLPPQQLNFLRRLGEHIDVMIYHFNPTQEYWADSVDSRWKKQFDLGIKERFIAQHTAKGKMVTDLELKQFFDEFTLNFNAEARESRHPLLTRLGKQARDNFSLLSNLASGEEGQWFDLFIDDHSSATLLGKLKSDIFNLLEPEKNAYPLQAEDRSIRVNVCHSLVRQLEVLKEQILLWLDRAPPDAPRSLEDILVLTPNIKAAEASIRSVFAPFTKGAATDVYLPIKITGIAQAQVTNAWASVLGRINLTKGRFQFEEFADWLSLPATMILYGLEYVEVERMMALLKEARFIRGFDTDHLKRVLPPSDTDYRYSFKYALERLSLGVLMDQHAVYQDVLAADFVQTADFELIGKLHSIYQDLHERSGWLGSQAELRQTDKWFETLLTDIKAYQDVGETNLNVVTDVIHGLLRPLSMSVYYDFSVKRSTASLVGLKLPLQYILEEIQHGIDTQLESAEPSGHITFCQAGYIRPLPYKLVVFLNLDNGNYPAYQNHNSFDLMSYLRPLLGDRSRLEDDQGAFLDAVLLAKEDFWVFYNGFDLDSGQVRQPSGILQELMDHIAFIVQTGQQNEQSPAYVSLSGVEVAENIQHLYKIHSLHPFDYKGFGESDQRLKTHWYLVADKIQNSVEKSQPWVNDIYTATQRSRSAVLGSRWISELTFPASLYLGSLSIKNIKPEDLVPDNEPLLLKGLENYAVREFMQTHPADSPELLADLLPVGKLKESAWAVSQNQYLDALNRLKLLASEPTRTKISQIRLSDDLEVSAQIPHSEQVKKWVVVKSSSAYGEHRAKSWLEYLLWLAALDLGDLGQTHAMLVVFKDATIVNTGISSDQAKTYLSHWVRAWKYGQEQPLVLPAKLLLTPLEKKKQLQWQFSEQDSLYHLDQMNDMIKIWNETFTFSQDYPLTENRANKKHRDWRYILQNQNSTELLIKCCQMFSRDLYKPVYDHQAIFNEYEHASLLEQQGESSLG